MLLLVIQPNEMQAFVSRDICSKKNHKEGMAQWMKYLPCMPVDLSLVPKNLCKKAGHSDTWLNPSMALLFPLGLLFSSHGAHRYPCGLP